MLSMFLMNEIKGFVDNMRKRSLVYLCMKRTRLKRSDTKEK